MPATDHQEPDQAGQGRARRRGATPPWTPTAARSAGSAGRRSSGAASRESRSPRLSPPSRSTPGLSALPPRPPARHGHRAPGRDATRWPRSDAAATASRDIPARSPGAAPVPARAGAAPMSSPPGAVRCDRNRGRGGGAALAVRAGWADQRRGQDPVPAQRGVAAAARDQPGGVGVVGDPVAAPVGAAGDRRCPECGRDGHRAPTPWRGQRCGRAPRSAERRKASSTTAASAIR